MIVVSIAEDVVVVCSAFAVGCDWVVVVYSKVVFVASVEVGTGSWMRKLGANSDDLKTTSGYNCGDHKRAMIKTLQPMINKVDNVPSTTVPKNKM